MSDNPDVEKCSYCKRPMVACYEVTRYNDKKEAEGSVHVCSIICLVRWSYSYAISQGVKAAGLVSHALGRVSDLVKGKR